MSAGRPRRPRVTGGSTAAYKQGQRSCFRQSNCYLLCVESVDCGSIVQRCNVGNLLYGDLLCRNHHVDMDLSTIQRPTANDRQCRTYQGTLFTYCNGPTMHRPSVNGPTV